MENAVAHKIEGQRQGAGTGAIEKLCAGGQQAAYNDADVEKISAVRAGLEGECRSVPDLVGEISRRATRCIPVSRFAGELVQNRERADRVAGDLRGNGEVRSGIESIVARHAAG